jgi:phosphoribosylaminoimidazole-succinocarboxamide synthase
MRCTIPLCNDDHIRVLGWASRRDRADARDLTHKVNAVLKPLFANAGIDLVDYKLEFGHPTDDPNGPLVLGDEFTPDGCRLWDARTGEKLDKDRFRRDLGRSDRALPRSREAHRRRKLLMDRAGAAGPFTSVSLEAGRASVAITGVGAGDGAGATIGAATAAGTTGF